MAGLHWESRFARSPAPSEYREGPPEINCWVVIQPDDAVIVRVARAEMGQGASTGLAMLVAEELECDWNKVRLEFVAPEAERAPPARLGRHVDRCEPLDLCIAARLA